MKTLACAGQGVRSNGKRGGLTRSEVCVVLLNNENRDNARSAISPRETYQRSGSG